MHREASSGPRGTSNPLFLSHQEPTLSLLVSVLVVTAVLALLAGLGFCLIHPHVCSLMQGDWCADPENDPTRS